MMRRACEITSRRRKLLLVGNAHRSFANHAAAVRKAVKVGAPPSIAAVASGADDPGTSNVCIRQIGGTRRVFLLDPYLIAPEMEGLAYRINALSRNEHINSILVASDETDDGATGALSSLLLDRDSPNPIDLGFPPVPGHTYHVSGGYDPRSMSTNGRANRELVEHTLSAMTSLSKVIQGDTKETKIPLISMPHGALTNGGFVWLQGAYAIATPETSYKVDSPSMGLSLDPVGLSYFLPRIGRDFLQPSREYPVGMLMGLTGYQATGFDLVACGLATNFVDSPNGLSILENDLSELPGWYQQTVVKKPKTFYGDAPPDRDINAPFRNVSVADAVQCFASIRANNSSAWSTDSGVYGVDGDPSLDPDCLYMEDLPPVHSDLVDIAAAFARAFDPTNSLQDIVGHVEEIANRQTEDPREQEGIDIAKEFHTRMSSRSPLALHATHRLLQLGYQDVSKRGRALRNRCLEREHIVQRNLFLKEDYQNWAEYASTEKVFTAWKHRSIAEVTKDEVEELFQP